MCAVVDPGGEAEGIERVIGEQELTAQKILLTHGHIDHAGAAAELKERLGVPIEGPSEEDRFLLSALAEQGRAYGMEGVRDVEPDRWLQEGDTVSLGELEFEVLHCPGHTPGHIVFIHRPSKLVIGGDVLFQGSIGRTDFPRGDHATLIASIKDKLFKLSDDYTVLPGHGPLTTIGHERASNPFLQEGATG